MSEEPLQDKQEWRTLQRRLPKSLYDLVCLTEASVAARLGMDIEKLLPDGSENPAREANLKEVTEWIYSSVLLEIMEDLPKSR